MSAPIRLILSPKCVSPLSPLNQHLDRKSHIPHNANKPNKFAKKLNFLASPRKEAHLPELNSGNRHFDEGPIHLVVPDLRKREGLLVNTPQKINILKNGLTENTAGLNILGRGSFGTVVKGLYKNQEVAVKVIKCDATSKLRESNILGFAHENIVKTIDVVAGQNQNHAMVIMEYLEHSVQLQSVLENRRIELGDACVAKFATDICRGLSYCHENGVLHLDVKPSNVLVCATGSCKLCDFGSCFKVDAPEPYTHQGTVAYTAPEILLGKEPTEKSDVYSFGVLLWQMAHREIPYANVDRNEIIIYKVVKFGLRPTGKGEGSFAPLYTRCWSSVAEERPGIAAVINLLSLY